MAKECRNCAYWSFDMDMDPFCVNENAGSWGTDINTMRGQKRSPNMRGEPCGPAAKYFEQGTHQWAAKETSV